MKLRLGTEELRLGIKDFARDFERGICMLMMFCIGAVAAMTLGAIPIAVVVELAGARFDDWLWLVYIIGAIFGVRILGSCADICLKME